MMRQSGVICRGAYAAPLASALLACAFLLAACGAQATGTSQPTPAGPVIHLPYPLARLYSGRVVVPPCVDYPVLPSPGSSSAATATTQPTTSGGGGGSLIILSTVGQTLGYWPMLPTWLPANQTWNSMDYFVRPANPPVSAAIASFHAGYRLVMPNLRVGHGYPRLPSLLFVDEARTTFAPTAYISSALSVADQQSVALGATSATLITLSGTAADGQSLRVLALLWQSGGVNVRLAASLAGTYPYVGAPFSGVPTPPPGLPAIDTLEAWSGVTAAALTQVAQSMRVYSGCP